MYNREETGTRRLKMNHEQQITEASSIEEQNDQEKQEISYRAIKIEFKFIGIQKKTKKKQIKRKKITRRICKEQ